MRYPGPHLSSITRQKFQHRNSV